MKIFIFSFPWIIKEKHKKKSLEKYIYKINNPGGKRTWRSYVVWTVWNNVWIYETKKFLHNISLLDFIFLCDDKYVGRPEAYQDRMMPKACHLCSWIKNAN